MRIVHWVILVIAALVALVNLMSFRARVRSGVGVSPPGTLMLTFLVASLGAVLAFRLSAFHLLWLFPLSVAFGFFWLPYPLSLVYKPAYAFGLLCCIGIGGAPLQSPLEAEARKASAQAFARTSPFVYTIGLIAWVGALLGAVLSVYSFATKAASLAGFRFLGTLCALTAWYLIDTSDLGRRHLWGNTLGASVPRRLAIVLAIILLWAASFLLFPTWQVAN